MGLRPLEIFLPLQSSESDVCRRQILTIKVNLRAVRVENDNSRDQQDKG